MGYVVEAHPAWISNLPLEKDSAVFAGTASSPLTCGELVQGRLAGFDFLISCPIDRYSRAEVLLAKTRPGRGTGRGGGGGAVAAARGEAERGAAGRGADLETDLLAELQTSFQTDVQTDLQENLQVKMTVHGGTRDRSKALRAVELTLAALGFGPGKGWLKLHRPAPPGKGLGTSTADICATVWATAAALGARLSPAQVAAIALSIEPTDGVMFPGLALFDHRRGRIARLLGPPPPMRVLILDPGGEVDTLEFNRRADLEPGSRCKEDLVRQALGKVLTGIRRGDPHLVGEGATLSALANQAILPKPDLEVIARAVRQLGAYGVAAAHSGTVIGVLLPDNRRLIDRVKDYIATRRKYRSLGLARVVPGGQGIFGEVEGHC